MKLSDVLTDSRAIADYIIELSNGDLDREFIESQFHRCRAVLRLVSLSDVKPGDPDHNIRDAKKEKLFLRKSLHTMPPLLIDNNVVIDGNHRYRVLLSKKIKQFHCYVVEKI